MIFGISTLLHGEYGSHLLRNILDAGTLIFDLDGTLVDSFQTSALLGNRSPWDAIKQVWMWMCWSPIR
jgi:hypothetical protein